jgi:hypothetical protein
LAAGLRKKKIKIRENGIDLENVDANGVLITGFKVLKIVANKGFYDK